MKFPLSDLNKINNLSPQKGNLILAEPFMEDDYFGRSVVFMCEHNKKGSYGFILNNKLEIFLDDIVFGNFSNFHPSSAFLNTKL